MGTHLNHKVALMIYDYASNTSNIQDEIFTLTNTVMNTSSSDTKKKFSVKTT